MFRKMILKQWNCNKVLWNEIPSAHRWNCLVKFQREDFGMRFPQPIVGIVQWNSNESTLEWDSLGPWSDFTIIYNLASCKRLLSDLKCVKVVQFSCSSQSSLQSPVSTTPVTVSTTLSPTTRHCSSSTVQLYPGGREKLLASPGMMYRNKYNNILNTSGMSK